MLSIFSRFSIPGKNGVAPSAYCYVLSMQFAGGQDAHYMKMRQYGCLTEYITIIIVNSHWYLVDKHVFRNSESIQNKKVLHFQ
jgi:uncharacterized membrane protein